MLLLPPTSTHTDTHFPIPTHVRSLYQPAHDVDRRVVAVEQAGGGDEAQRGRGVRLGGGLGGVSGRDGIHPPIVAPASKPAPPGAGAAAPVRLRNGAIDRKSTRLNSST